MQQIFLLLIFFHIADSIRCDIYQNLDTQFCYLNDKDSPCNRVQAKVRPENSLDDTENCYRAAVFEHKPAGDDIPLNSLDCRIRAHKSIATFRDIAKLAKQNGAQIIVFPEDALFLCDRKSMASFANEVPDPKFLNSKNNNPCRQPSQFASSDILRNLSCIALQNNIYLVANFGAKETCEPRSKVLEQTCPPDGFFMFNTDVIFNNEGELIGRYRKYNLFLEVFDRAPSMEAIYFDSPFGRFGIFTCFDILFPRPALELVKTYGIDTALFPTLWYDELPVLSAIQYQDAWSLRNNVNLLASNMHVRRKGSVGSGIFSGKNSVYTQAYIYNSRLLIANLPKNSSVSTKCDNEFNPLEIDVGLRDDPHSFYFKLDYPLLTSDTIRTLTKLEDKRTICNGKLCCFFDYKISSSLPSEDLNRIVLIARDGRRPGFFKWYEQTCFLATLELPLDEEHYNKTTFYQKGLASFNKLHIEGSFSHHYVFPIAAHNVSRLIERREREFGCTKIDELEEEYLCSQSYIPSDNYSKQNGQPIYSFGLYGRLYSEDIMPEGW